MARTRLDFETIFNCLPAPFLVMDRDFNVVAINDAFLEVEKRTRQSLVGTNFFESFPAPGESVQILRASLEGVRDRAATGVTPVLPFRFDIDGHAIERFLSCTYMPVVDDGGKVAYIIKAIQNISDVPPLKDLSALPASKEGTPECGGILLPGTTYILNQTLLATVHHLRRLVMQAPSFMCVLRGPDLVFELVNVAFSMLAGGRELLGKTLREGLPESESQEYPKILANIFKTGEVYVGRKSRILLQDNPNAEFEEHYIDFVAQPILGTRGEVDGIFIEGNDVTDHVKTEQRQALLIRELHHRVRNTLATVQGVMNTTAKTSATIDEFQEAFTGRISSLAKTHAVMTEQLHQSVSFCQLLAQELGPYADEEGSRISLDGPAIDLPSQIAVPLGMAIHELTTNAVRHGALSSEAGRIEVGWYVDDRGGERTLFCEWDESAGPPVKPPTRDGFGSMLLKRVLSQQIRADVKVDFAPEGFRLRMAVPLQAER